MRRKKIFDLDRLIEQETKRVMDGILDKERVLQQQQSVKNKPYKAPEKSEKQDVEKDKDNNKDVDEAEDEESGAKVKKTSLPEIDLASIINLIDGLRAGKSLKDKTVKADLKAYYQRLNESERIALYAFLTGLSEVMTDSDGDAGATADVPAKDPYKVKMKRQAPDIDKKEKSKGEDSPIVVGEVANKSRERRILLINNRRTKK
tara:strand:+ start:644 stop:1255 length:612 start_codon:yes stop_codon:yes gene_type:complete